MPQYFRHNRFQSLVRQLNFYSFRKINRERNVWIYKHNLFRRDSPEDLYLVRRRTCPGMDGRKQRFSRGNSRKSFDDGQTVKSDDDSCSSEIETSPSAVATIVEESTFLTLGNMKKHNFGLSSFAESQINRALIYSSNTPSIIQGKNNYVPSVPIDNSSYQTIDTTLVEYVDTSMVECDDAELSEDTDDHVSIAAINDDRMEMIEQSIIVSEVAMKLEQFAKKAMHGVGGSRTRRGGSGVVTPPFSSSSTNDARGIITYDDEPWYDSEDYKMGDVSPSLSKKFDTIKNTTKSVHISDLSASRNLKLVTPTKPIADRKTVEGIVQRILRSSNDKTPGHLVASANVAGFCMSMIPQSNSDLCAKVIHLISSCESLAKEFHLYRAALHPSEPSDRMFSSSIFGCVYPNSRSNNSGTPLDIWHGEGSRSDAVRDFSIFAVNCLHKLLGRNDIHGENDIDSKNKSFLSHRDLKILEHTADIWQKSVGVNDHARYQ